MSKKRIGIFGGTFSPFHNGHLNGALAVSEKLALNELKIIPAYQSPDRLPIEGPTAEARLEMVRAGIGSYRSLLQVDDREIRRARVSFTWETIQELVDEEPDAEFFLIIGTDQLEKFDQWRSYEKILATVNLVVMNRPGFHFPHSRDDWAQGLRDKLPDYETGDEHVEWLGGHHIILLSIPEFDVSGSEIRRRLRNQESLEGLVPDKVEAMILQNGWYRELQARIKDYRELTLEVGRILKERNALNIQGFDLGPHHHLAEFSVVASGGNTRQTAAIAEYLIKQIHSRFGVWPQNIEGQSEGRWIVVDYSSLIVHIFYDFTRNEYRIEDLWKGQVRLDLNESDQAQTAIKSESKAK